MPLQGIHFLQKDSQEASSDKEEIPLLPLKRKGTRGYRHGKRGWYNDYQLQLGLGSWCLGGTCGVKGQEM